MSSPYPYPLPEEAAQCLIPVTLTAEEGWSFRRGFGTAGSLLLARSRTSHPIPWAAQQHAPEAELAVMGKACQGLRALNQGTPR